MSKSRTIRFAVGSVGGHRSGEWRVITKGSDVYIESIGLAGVRKVSLHRSGKWSDAFTSEFFREKPDWLDGLDDRSSERWIRPKDLSLGVSLAFRIIVPTSELETFEAREKSLKTVWVRSAPEQG